MSFTMFLRDLGMKVSKAGFFKTLFIYFCSAGVLLRWFSFSSCGKQGRSPAVPGLRTVVASLVAASAGPQALGLQ